MTLVDLPTGMKGFDGVDLVPGCTYQDSSTVFICPTRGQVDVTVVEAWNRLVPVPNQRRHMLFMKGDEVGVAYNRALETIFNDYRLSRYKYVMTMEDDNIPPPDAHMRLLDRIQQNPEYDGIGGLYFKKEAPFQALLLGDPVRFATTGVFDALPRDPRRYIEEGALVEVNCLPMGCTIYKMDLFRRLPKPWFATIANQHIRQTQDAMFCETAKWQGARFAVDCGLRVGHLDVATGTVY